MKNNKENTMKLIYKYLLDKEQFINKFSKTEEK